MGRKLHNNDGSGAASKKSDESINTGEGALRAVTTIYAFCICILAAISNLMIGPWAYSSVGQKNTPLQASQPRPFSALRIDPRKLSNDT